MFQLCEQDSLYPYLSYVSWVLKGSLKRRDHKAVQGTSIAPTSYSLPFVLILSIDSCFSPRIPLNHCLHLSHFPAQFPLLFSVQFFHAGASLTTHWCASELIARNTGKNYAWSKQRVNSSCLTCMLLPICFSWHSITSFPFISEKL